MRWRTCGLPAKRSVNTMRTERYLNVSLVLAVLIASAARAQGPLPADVHPETLNRLPPPHVEADSAAASIRAKGTGSIVRWEFAEGRALSELAILAVARELDQPYEWSLHEIEALAVGLSPRTIDVVRNRESLAGLDEKEAVIIRLGRELVGDHAVSRETYAQAERLLGRANLVDVVSLMGNYVATALRLTAFNQQMPPGWAQLLPLPFEPPDDIHADSRSRLPYLRIDIRDSVTTPPLYGRQLAPEGTGPGLIRRHSAGLDSLEARVGSRLIRLTALIAARGLDSQYLWTMSELAATESVEAHVIDLIRDGRPLTDIDERAAALIEFGRELFGMNTVSAATYARALALFGQTDLVDLVESMAQHARDAIVLIAFRQQLPPGQNALLPIPHRTP